MAGSAARSTARHGATKLLERESELDRTISAIERAGAGAGSLLVVLGPAGAGKTSLLQEALSIAQDHRFTVLHGRGGELESSLAFGVVRNLFERPLAALGEGEREAVLKGAAGLAAPALALGDAGAAGPGSAEATFAALHGLYWLSANLAQQSPLLIAVDDAHWADVASLRFLAYLARRIDELPIAMIVASRPREPGSDVELLDALISSPPGQVITPRPLSEAAAAELLRTGLGTAPAGEFAHAFHEATGGNPLLTSSLIATLSAEGVEPSAAAAHRLSRQGTEEIGRSVQARLRRLGAAPTALAEAVAALGSSVELRQAAELAGLEQGDAADAADVLAGEQILHDRRPLEFVHPVVRAAIYDALSHGERSRAHARAARLLAASPELAAPHLLATDPAGDPGVAEQLRESARAASRSGAPETAVLRLRRALAEPPGEELRSHVLRELGVAEQMTGDPAGVEHLRAALESTPAPRMRAEIACELALGLLPQGRFVDAVGVLEAAIASLGEADGELVLQLEAELASAARLDPLTQPKAPARLAPLRELITGSSEGERAVAASLGFERALSGGTAAEAAELAELALCGDQRPESPAFADSMATLIMAERYERARRALDDGIVDARRRGSLMGFAVASAFRSLLGVREGALAEAEGDARAAVEAAAQAGWSALESMALAFLVEALVDRGELDAAAEALSPHTNSEIADTLMLNFLLHARGRLRLASGQLEAGLADLSELARREGALGWHNPARFEHRSAAATALTRLERRVEARALAEEELELARGWGSPRAIGVALRAAGLAAGEDEGIKRLRESVACLEESGARLEHARALIELGAALRRSGSRRDSREPLAHGMELAHRCGAARLAERAREELVAAGARPRRMVRSGVDAMTPSELRVARMASEGMTNREIAQALFVTMRTVEVHLTHAYQKLDISSREELPGVLAAGPR